VPYRLTVSRVENLMLGDAVEATAEQREWMFEGNRDDFVIVTMEALDENDGPILRLLDENGIVISASEGGPGSEAVLDTIRLPDDGIYFLNTGWEGTPGRYQVSLDRVEPDRFAPGGTIQNASAEQRLWAFEGDSGEIVTVIMEAQDEQGVPLLKLRDEFGEVIASAEHGDDHIASICSIWLPTTGRYVVETGWKARPGNYTLSLTRIELESRKLEFGDTLENVPPEQCIWQFKGNRGDFVAIAIDAQDPSGDPLLALLDENGGEITFNDDVDTDLNPRLEAVLPTTGTYLINTDWIGPPGPYSLSLARVEPITITISDVPESAGPGQSLWQFEGNQGDFLTIAMDTLDLDGNPLLTLYNEAGQVIEVSDHGGVGRNALLHVILQKDSSYIINAGWMSQPASYTLALNQIDVGLLNLPAAEREADPDQWAWRFEGERGDYVTIAMDAVEDEGDPLLRLYDENGQFVAENDDNYRLNALLQLSLPESGVYFIDAGWFSNPGRYRLTLRQTNVEVDVESVAADSRQEALQLIKNGDVEEGLSLFKEVELIEASLPTTLLSARDYNWVCWYGSLWDYTAEVMFACEVAAKREPENGGFANSRGVARALTGDLEGAIDDFRAYLGWGLGGNNELRQEWIEELEAGRNPFDDEALLEHLRNEE